MGFLDDKVVVVTGAGSGIGRASAQQYARNGARVHVVDIAGERVSEVCEQLAADGHIATGHTLDCADGEAVGELARRVLEAEGRVHVLQNTVGVLVAAPTEELRLEDWRRAIDINLGSVVNGVHAFLPSMVERGEGHIVNVSSLAGLVGFPYTVPYSTTKFAIVGLSEALALEMAGRGVGVTVVCPGMVRSNLIADGTLRLPGRWPEIFDRAYAAFAPDPERLAKKIVRAVRRKQTLIAPSLLLGQLWWLKRLTGSSYHRGAASAAIGLRWVGDRLAAFGDKESR